MLLFIFKSANNPYPVDLTFNHGFNHGKCLMPCAVAAWSLAQEVNFIHVAVLVEIH